MREGGRGGGEEGERRERGGGEEGDRIVLLCDPILSAAGGDPIAHNQEVIVWVILAAL